MMFRVVIGVTIVIVGFVIGVTVGSQPETETQTQIQTLASSPRVFTLSFPLSETVMPHGDHVLTPDGPRSQWMYHTEVVPEHMAVTGFKVMVENAPPEIIHHLSLVSQGSADEVCGNSTHARQREYFTISRSNIYESVSFDAPYALHIQKGERLSLEVMTHVLEKPHGPGGSYPDAKVYIELTYEDMSARPEPVSFVRLRLDDTECAEPLMHQAFVVPQGEGVFTRAASTTAGESSDTYTFNVPGVMLARSANLWGTKGGRSLQVFKNGKPLETYSVVQGSEPWIWTIPSVTTPLRVSAGDTLTISADYIQATSTRIMDASGMFGFYFAPDKEIEQDATPNTQKKIPVQVDGFTITSIAGEDLAPINDTTMYPDAETFIQVLYENKTTSYYRDTKHVFHSGGPVESRLIVLPNIDAASFEFLFAENIPCNAEIHNCEDAFPTIINIARDKNAIYSAFASDWLKPLPGMDSQSFKITSSPISTSDSYYLTAQDKSGTYSISNNGVY